MMTSESVMTTPSENKSSEWCIDSGASQHMANDVSILSNVKHYKKPSPVYLGDKSQVLSYAEGQLRLKTLCKEGTYLALKKVLFVPKLMKNLLSVRTMTKQGAEVIFKGDKCVVHKDGRTVEIGTSVNGGLYKLQSSVATPALAENVNDSACYASVGPLSLWHQRFGHLNMTDLSKLSKNDEL